MTDRWGVVMYLGEILEKFLNFENDLWNSVAVPKSDAATRYFCHVFYRYLGASYTLRKETSHFGYFYLDMAVQ